jgi:hypothetical protein
LADAHLEAAQEAATSEVAAHRRSSSSRAIGRRNQKIGFNQRASAAQVRVWMRSRKATFMKFPAILQGEARTRFLQGIAFGAVATIAIGFAWGGWVTGETARIMRITAESDGRMSVLVPLCVAQFSAADGALAKFKAASPYSRENVVSEFVKTVASTSMDYSFAKACATGIEAELAKTGAKT